MGVEPTSGVVGNDTSHHVHPHVWSMRKDLHLLSQPYQGCAGLYLLHIENGLSGWCCPNTSEFQARPSAVDLHSDEMVRMAGVAPAAPAFRGRSSTADLHPECWRFGLDLHQWLPRFAGGSLGYSGTEPKIERLYRNAASPEFHRSRRGQCADTQQPFALECRNGVEPFMESGHSGVRLPSQRHAIGTPGGSRTHRTHGLNVLSLPFDYRGRRWRR